MAVLVEQRRRRSPENPVDGPACPSKVRTRPAMPPVALECGQPPRSLERESKNGLVHGCGAAGREGLGGQVCRSGVRPHRQAARPQHRGQPAGAARDLVDIVPAAADELARSLNARTAPDPATALADPGIDAVLIASSTNTHVDLIRARPRPARRCCARSRSTSTSPGSTPAGARRPAHAPIAIGFNRRFDPPRAVRDASRRRHRRARQVIITSRDPGRRRRVHQGLGRPVPGHDDPRLRPGALSGRGERRGRGHGRATWSTPGSGGSVTSTPP